MLPKHLEFGGGCRNFTGPHSLACYQQVWMQAGCDSEGHYYPQSLEFVRTTTYYKQNLRYLTRFETDFFLMCCLNLTFFFECNMENGSISVVL